MEYNVTKQFKSLVIKYQKIDSLPQLCPALRLMTENIEPLCILHGQYKYREAISEPDERERDEIEESQEDITNEDHKKITYEFKKADILACLFGLIINDKIDHQTALKELPVYLNASNPSISTAEAKKLSDAFIVLRQLIKQEETFYQKIFEKELKNQSPQFLKEYMDSVKNILTEHLEKYKNNLLIHSYLNDPIYEKAMQRVAHLKKAQERYYKHERKKAKKKKFNSENKEEIDTSPTKHARITFAPSITQFFFTSEEEETEKTNEVETNDVVKNKCVRLIT